MLGGQFAILLLGLSKVFRYGSAVGDVFNRRHSLPAKHFWELLVVLGCELPILRFGLVDLSLFIIVHRELVMISNRFAAHALNVRRPPPRRSFGRQ